VAMLGVPGTDLVRYEEKKIRPRHIRPTGGTCSTSPHEVIKKRSGGENRKKRKNHKVKEKLRENF